MKAQVLVDFLVECTWLVDELEEVLVEPHTKPSDVGLTCIFHVDGVFNSQGSRMGLIPMNSERVVIGYALCFLFKVINN